MNAFISTRHTLIAAAVAALLLTACASTPVEPDGAAALRARLTALQSDPQLGSRAPLAMEQANIAVTAAEKPNADKVSSAHSCGRGSRCSPTRLPNWPSPGGSSPTPSAGCRAPCPGFWWPPCR